MHLTPIIFNGGECVHTQAQHSGVYTRGHSLPPIIKIPAPCFLNICKVKHNLVQDFKTIWVYVSERKLDCYITKVCKFTL